MHYAFTVSPIGLIPLPVRIYRTTAAASAGTVLYRVMRTPRHRVINHHDHDHDHIMMTASQLRVRSGAHAQSTCDRESVTHAGKDDAG
jgi:hypothetical protein